MVVAMRMMAIILKHPPGAVAVVVDAVAASRVHWPRLLLISGPVGIPHTTRPPAEPNAVLASVSAASALRVIPFSVGPPRALVIPSTWTPRDRT